MKKEYLAPAITVVKISVERGFDGSNNNMAVSSFEFQMDEIASSNEAAGYSYSDWNW